MPRADTTELVAAVGEAAARQLIEAFGGRSLAVPRRPGSMGHAQLVECLGEPAAAALCLHFGGTEVYIPKPDADHRRARNTRLRADYDSGIPVADLVTRYRLSERWVYAVLGGSDDDDNQMALF